LSEMLVHRADAYTLTFDQQAQLFRVNQGSQVLTLACQGMVSTLEGIDTGTEWRLAAVREAGDAVLWRLVADSSCWQRKALLVELRARDIRFRIHVQGNGAIDRVTFFAGVPTTFTNEASATMRTLAWATHPITCAWVGSPINHRQVFNSQPNAYEEQSLPATCGQRITSATTFGPERFNTFFAPPLFAYVLDERFCLGIAAEPGENRYTHFDYLSAAGWGCELHYDGMTRVDGEWTSPALRVAPCDSIDDGLRAYVTALQAEGLTPRPPRSPAWVWKPMVCGWGQQTVWAKMAEQGESLPLGSPLTPGAPGFCTQDAYTLFLHLLGDLPYGTVTVDMGWSTCMTIPQPDMTRWPDLKGFIADLHARGKRVMLWLATWNPEGLDPALCIPHAPGLADCADPTNSEFRRRLREAIHQAISPEGLDADGFKLDFTGDLPRGRGYQPAENLWGMELLHEYIQLIASTMRDAKAEAVLETHCANPYFVDVTDMLRLNDIFCTHEDVRPMMAFRARIARLVNPHWPIDTDNDPFISRQAWLEYMRFQPTIGIPSLYTATHMSFSLPATPLEVVTPEDLQEIKGIWVEWLERRHDC